jgi:hypothetical protein
MGGMGEGRTGVIGLAICSDVYGVGIRSTGEC